MLTIGTRGSDLALWQAEWVRSRLQQCGTASRLKVIKTQGDNIQDVPLSALEGKGFFTKEIEDALLGGSIDLAVHSLKDLPTQDTPGLRVVAVTKREDHRDCLLIAPDGYDPDAGVIPVRYGATVGTGSIRRSSQLKSMRDDLNVVDLRGNVPTRLRKLREREFDATLMANAGLIRLQLDLGDIVRVVLDPEDFVPAAGQGALAIQVRADDEESAIAARRLEDAAAARQVASERGLLARLEGGCQLPLGASSLDDGGRVRLRVFFGGSSEYAGSVNAAFEAESPEQAVDMAFAAITDGKGVGK